MKKPKVISFFAGIGGFDLGLERAGMNVVAQCEIDPFCQTLLRAHWPDVKLLGDISKVESKDLPDADVWAGGFPCQDVSLANQGRRAGLKGARTGLFHEFMRLAEKRKPEWIILENVVGLLNSNEGRDFHVVISRLVELGYGVAWRVLDAKYFGSPQRRRRVFIVGHLGDRSAEAVLLGKGSGAEVVAATRKPGAHSPGRSTVGTEKDRVYLIQHASIGRKPSAGPQAKGYRWDGEAYTLDSRGGADVVCAPSAPFRVRGSAGISRGLDSRRYRVLGNAVNVNVAEWLGRRILKANRVK